MTSTQTNRLKRSPVRSAPLTPALSSSTKGGRKRYRDSPVSTRKMLAASVATAVTSSITALSVSDTKGMASTSENPPTAWEITGSVRCQAQQPERAEADGDRHADQHRGVDRPAAHEQQDSRPEQRGHDEDRQEGGGNGGNHESGFSPVAGCWDISSSLPITARVSMKMVTAMVMTIAVQHESLRERVRHVGARGDVGERLGTPSRHSGRPGARSSRRG